VIEKIFQYFWLFIDQLIAHKNIKLVIDALWSYVMLWFLTANTSHFLQPYNDLVRTKFTKQLSND